VAVLAAPIPLLEGFGIHGPSFAVFGLLRLVVVITFVLACFLWSARFRLISPDGRSARRLLAVGYGFGASSPSSNGQSGTGVAV
jgi:hypothetical protein